MSDVPQALKIIKKSLIEQIAEKIAEIDSLKAALEKEHENYLSVHRDNMELASRNMDLKAELQEAKEDAKQIREAFNTQWQTDQKWKAIALEARELIERIRGFAYEYSTQGGAVARAGHSIILAKIAAWRKG